MRILLVQTSFLGDVVLSTPVIAALRAKFKDAEIWMLTTPAARGLVARDPELAGVLTFDKNGAERTFTALSRKAQELRALRFDRAYALQRSMRTSVLLWLAGIPLRVGFRQSRFAFLYHEKRPRDATRHEVLRNLQIVGDLDVHSSSMQMRIYPPKDSDVSIEIREALASKLKPVVLVPGSAWPTKRWDWRGFREVARQLVKVGRTIVVVGGDDDVGVAKIVCGNLPVVNLAGRASLADLTWIISNAGLVVCNDSLALHLASALKIPTVALFCATSPNFGFGPWNNDAIVLEVEDLPCKPCSRHGTVDCPTGTWACMRELSPTRVLHAAQGLVR